MRGQFRIQRGQLVAGLDSIGGIGFGVFGILLCQRRGNGAQPKLAIAGVQPGMRIQPGMVVPVTRVVPGVASTTTLSSVTPDLIRGPAAARPRGEKLFTVAYRAADAALPDAIS